MHRRNNSTYLALHLQRIGRLASAFLLPLARTLLTRLPFIPRDGAGI